MGKSLIREKIDLLISAGVTELNKAKIEKLEQSWESIPEEIRVEMEDKNIFGMILTELGAGKYNYEEGTWTPSSHMIYCFDAEIFNIERMFTNVIKGIETINNGEFAITNITEETTELDEEDGSGKQVVQFKYNDKSYTYEGRLEYDWFDPGFLVFFNEVLVAENNPKKLLITTDGYQQYIVFYNTEEWAHQFTEKTGLTL